MVDFGFPSGKDDSAVEDLISQAKDLNVLEQVAKINCAGFTDDSALPSNLETRFRRLKSLPVSSSSKKLLSHSKSMASYPEKKRGNVSSVSSFTNFSGNLTGKSCPLDSCVGIKRNPSVNSGFEKISRGGFGLETSRGFSDSGRIGSSSSRFSREGKVFTPTTTTQTLNFLPKEKSRISSSSLTSIDLASPSSDQDQKEGMKQKSKLKSKSKLLVSWFDKLSLAQAMGCVPGKPSSNSKKTKESSKKELSWEEEFEKTKKRVEKESRQRERMVYKLVKRSQRLRSESTFDNLLGMLF